MKKYYWVIIAFMSFWMTGTKAQNAENMTQVNLVKNADFEAGLAEWKIPDNTANVAEGISQSGNHSLYYHNTDPKQYKLFIQDIDVNPGEVLDFSVWVKGKNVVGAGAGIFLQSADTHGKHIMGSPYGGFPPTLNGTFGWTKISGEYLVPNDERSTQVGVYLRKGSTGEVWFDDVQIHPVKPVTIKSFLVYPHYHGLILKGNNIPWRADLEISAHPKWNHDIDITSLLIDSTGKVLLTQTDLVSSQIKQSTITVEPPTNLPVGNYHLKQTMKSSDGQILGVKDYTVHVVASMPKVHIDAQGFTIVDGKRFFPLGAYTGPMGSGGGHDANAGEADLKRMADAGLNTVLSYGYANRPINDGRAFLQLAQKNKLHVIYSVKDMYNGHGGYPMNGLSGQEAAKAQIEQVKDSPALLGWYINDEMGGEWLKAIQMRYDQIWDMDGNHPAYIVSYKPHVNDEYYPMTDVLGMDPYPIGYGKSIDLVTSWTRETVRATRGTKGIWTVLQIFNPVFAGKEDKSPTRDEMRNMSYQALINGSKGLVYYAYHWLFFAQDKDGKRVYSQEAFNKRWPDVKRTIQEISSIKDVILHDDKVELNRIVLTDVQSNTQLIDEKLYLKLPLNVQYQAWQYQGKLYVITVNTSEDKSKTLKLQIPSGWRLSDINVPGIKSHISEDILSLDFDPIASGVVILQR